MRPFDPRLLRVARSTRLLLAGGSLVGVLQAVATVAFAAAIAAAFATLIGAAEYDLTLATLVAAVAIVLRAASGWLWEYLGLAGAARAKAELRAAAMAALDTLGPGYVLRRSSADVSTLIGPGLDALDAYFSKYVPQLILTVVATPILIVATFIADPTSAIIEIIVLPLIPLFLALIGMATGSVQKAQWNALRGLSTNFLDVVGGMSTLILYGRQYRQADRIRTITNDYRTRTMRVLRITFLSGFTLELGASLSVALVAVTAGFRLVDGVMLLAPALFVIVLAPDVFLPLRNVGTHFHAAADGIAAADDVLGLIDEANASGDAEQKPVVSAVGADVRLDALCLDRGELRVIDALSGTIPAGSIAALTGPSGSGKSSLIGAMLGFVAFSGSITIAGRDLTRADVAWVPQKPQLIAGTVAANLALGEEAVDVESARSALDAAGASDIDLERELGPGGSGLSGGQAQRVSIARALYRARAHGCAVVVLDEPTSALDEERENDVVSIMRTLAHENRVVIVASHRPAVIAAANAHIRLGAFTHV